MKQQRIALTLLASSCCLLSFSLQSCTSSLSDSSPVLRKVADNSRTFLLNSVEQLNAVARYDDALILVTREGCHYCEQERGHLTEYIKTSETLIYEVDRSTYMEAYESVTNETGTYANLYPKMSGYPTYLFYANGALQDSHHGIYGETEEECISNYQKYIVPSDIYIMNDFSEYVRGNDGIIFSQFNTCEELEEAKMMDTIGYSTNRLDTLLESDKKKTIFFSWRRCSDCKNYKTYVLHPYFRKNQGKIYTYEVDGYYLLKRSEDTALEKLGLSMWADFSQKYHLSDYPNIDKYGNTAGFVPTLVTYENSSYTIDVFANDSDIVRNDNGTVSYSKSFHDEVKEIKSVTKVKEGDTTSSNYQSAVKEIKSKAQQVEIELSTAYLEEAMK